MITSMLIKNMLRRTIVIVIMDKQINIAMMTAMILQVTFEKEVAAQSLPINLKLSMIPFLIATMILPRNNIMN